MCKRKFTGVKQHRVHFEVFEPEFVLLVAAVRSISYDGVKNMSKMPPKLMHPSGFGSGFYQGISRSAMFPERNLQLKML